MSEPQNEPTLSEEDQKVVFELVNYINNRLDEAHLEKPMAVTYIVAGLIAATALLSAAQNDFDLALHYMPKLLDNIRRQMADYISRMLDKEAQ